MLIQLKVKVDTLNEQNSISIPTDIFTDPALSPEALGLLLFLYSTNETEFEYERLKGTPLSGEELQAALDNLQENGYIEKASH
ncbi:hypothetical protein [Shouchella shacheensis]|uniref:hypothetical protein n=1 Tax=Shouchella shacheensis TaxID=1649580 RepID=UPI0007402024|nr:hypothetical protein [Shouchella shacheensis]